MTRNAGSLLVLVTMAAASAGCGGGAGAESETPGGRATAAIDGTTYAVSDVKLTFEPGDGGYFRIEGRDAAHPDEDCVSGLGGGLALYGDAPEGASSVADLSGKEASFDFTGDGDDFNLCFVGSNGLLGVENGTVTFGEVRGNSVAFTFSGTFVRYDGQGGESAPNVRASGSGTATVD
jgi:hypothetical protein